METTAALDAWTFTESGLAALLVTLISTPLVIWAARTFGWVDRPSEDRWHEQPTALMGGIAIFGGVSVGLLWSGAGNTAVLFWSAAALMFGVGLVDDVWFVPPTGKLTVQVGATGLLIYGGYVFGPGLPAWLSLPLTFLWVIGITNSVNLLDNMDGLAAGIAGIAACVFGGFGVLGTGGSSVAIAAAVAGAAFGFLVYNMKPSRIFMGDCGSLVLGFVLAGLGLLVQAEATIGDPVAVALMPLVVLAVPILDTTLVTVMRCLAGRAVSQGGSDHASHRLVVLGLSERHAVWVLYGLSLLSGAGALLLLVADAVLFYAVAGLGVVGLGVVGLHLARVRVYEAEASALPRTALVRRPLQVLRRLAGDRWKAVLGVLGDTMLVGAAFVVAHSLRHGFGLPDPVKEHVVAVLPLVIAAKVAVFYGGGLYRGLWRHAGTPELVRMVATTLAASVVGAGLLVVLHGTASVSAAALVIDWMATTGAVGGARFGFRGLRQYVAARRTGERRVLLYGAGDTGLLALRTLQSQLDPAIDPVGFVDGDPLKQGQSVQGLPVLGDRDDLPGLCRRHDVDEVILAPDARVPERRQRVADTCDAIDVQCREFVVSCEPVAPRDGESPVGLPMGSAGARKFTNGR